MGLPWLLSGSKVLSTSEFPFCDRRGPRRGQMTGRYTIQSSLLGSSIAQPIARRQSNLAAA